MSTIKHTRRSFMMKKSKPRAEKHNCSIEDRNKIVLKMLKVSGIYTPRQTEILMYISKHNDMRFYDIDKQFNLNKGCIGKTFRDAKHRYEKHLLQLEDSLYEVLLM